MGVPGRSLTLDAVLNILLIVLLGSPVAILLASNFGYLFGVILALGGFLLLRRDRPQWPRPIHLGRVWIPIAVAILAINCFVLVVGATHPQLLGYGGYKETIIGLAILLIAVAMFVYRQVVQDRRPLQWRIATPSMPDADEAALLAEEMADEAEDRAVHLSPPRPGAEEHEHRDHDARRASSLAVAAVARVRQDGFPFRHRGLGRAGVRNTSVRH